MSDLAKLDQAKLCKYEHWTAGSPVRMVRWVASDFIAQLEVRLEHLDYTHADLAKRLDVSLGRVSQVMNSPGNFTLKNGCSYAGALGMNFAIVTYPADVRSAPVSGDVFRTCWEIAGRPTNMFEIQENTVGFATNCGGMACIGHVWETPSIKAEAGTFRELSCTAHTDSRGIVSNVSVCTS